MRPPTKRYLLELMNANTGHTHVHSVFADDAQEALDRTAELVGLLGHQATMRVMAGETLEGAGNA